MKNSRGLAKKLLIGVPLLAITSCAPKAPVESDYFTGKAPIDINSYMNAEAKDIDGDGIGDVIVAKEGKAIYYSKDHKDDLPVTKTSIEMDSAMTEDLTNYIKSDNKLRFHAAKLLYEKNKVMYDSTGVKK